MGLDWIGYPILLWHQEQELKVWKYIFNGKVSNYLQRVTSSYDTSVIVYDTNTKTQTGIRIRMYGASKYDIADGRIEGQNSSSWFVVWTGWMEWDDWRLKSA